MNNDQARKIFAKEKHIREFYKDISLTPLILAKNDYGYIKDVTESIANILEKTVKIYFKDKKTQDFFDFNSKQKNIIQDFRPDLFTLYLSRFDGFWDDDKKDLKFLEFNTNFPGGVDRLDKVNEKVNLLHKEKYLSSGNLKNSYIKMVKNLYDKTDKQGIFLMVYGTMFEEASKKSLNELGKSVEEELGIESIYTHWKNLEYKNNNIYYKNKKVSLIFRATLTQRMWQYDYKYVKPMLEIIKSNKQIIMFNLPQSYICGAKNLFALWYEDWFLKYLTKNDISCIKKHIPKTLLLSNRNLKKDILIRDKDNWVLKPIAGIGGKMVYVGKKYSLKEWARIIDVHLKSKYWIAQEFVKTNIYNIDSLDTAKEKITMQSVYLNFSPWIINKKFAGISVRYSTDLVINVKKGGGIMTSVIANEV